MLEVGIALGLLAVSLWLGTLAVTRSGHSALDVLLLVGIGLLLAAFAYYVIKASSAAACPLG
jgi:hypothetical protein